MSAGKTWKQWIVLLADVSVRVRVGIYYLTNPTNLQMHGYIKHQSIGRESEREEGDGEREGDRETQKEVYVCMCVVVVVVVVVAAAAAAVVVVAAAVVAVVVVVEWRWAGSVEYLPWQRGYLIGKVVEQAPGGTVSYVVWVAWLMNDVAIMQL